MSKSGALNETCVVLVLLCWLGPSASHGADPPAARGATTQPAPKLAKAQIVRVVRSHTKEVRRCYERAAATAPRLAGQLGVEISIGPSGRVLSTRVRYSTLGKPAVDGCVTHAIRGWRFPKPRDGSRVVIIYPFVFQQRGSKPALPPRLTRALVQQGMRAVTPQVRRCSARFKQAGTAKVRTTIDRSGRVTEAVVEGAFAGTETGSCLQAAVLTARFPRFTGEPITFTYPYVLR